MPHQCTNCGRAFDDGSKEMLSGCPDCGGNKFQFRPDGIDSQAPPDPDAEPPEPPEPPGADSTVARTVGKTAATVRDIVGGGNDDPTVGADAGAASSTGASGSDDASPGVDRSEAATRREVDTQTPDTEDAAQASARADVVTPDELPQEPQSDADDEHHFQPVGADPDPPEEPDETERPDLKELREELNDQFESIKVLEPGQYELNLMELYDREEYIVALQEDGRYSIQVPETFRE
ncbi:Zn-ribbon domain-containing protein [Halomicroarcula sp. S1AR25-4]|uniref:OapC/ArvC family zinc-ribbon domain-containing protein n=1 Tax=Haloarcula sp. S1AR25-4 TaxID=2950538 RepID=UPI002874F94B|nr:Zn-ribbon containing protein [Halomicroarcula sp. S1AR25-4]MDS0278970.1 Zn-ribbon domain-containing protein [Halomicroarcula sp. S1AR25-4]